MIDKKYIKYYIFGYLNQYYNDLHFAYNSSRGSYKQHKIKEVFRYAGLKDVKVDLSKFANTFSLLEALASTILVLFRTFCVSVKKICLKKRDYHGMTFMASLNIASYRLKGLLDLPTPLPITTIKIPYIKSEYKVNDVDILSVISILDIFNSLQATWKTIWTIYAKYRQRDVFFRSYSSFEFYLTCLFVRKTEEDNEFVFYSTYARWAFLMCNTKGSTFIQHGKLMDTIQLIRIGTPKTAYYLSKRQGKIVEKVLFSRVPNKVGYRKTLEFTGNELLLNNGKLNILLVCWSHNIDKEWVICKLLSQDYNLYIKPHPGDKDNPEYPKMAKKYNCVMIPKAGYPKVDAVISYDSTLADEYEDVNIKVVRYDLLDNLEAIRKEL